MMMRLACVALFLASLSAFSQPPALRHDGIYMSDREDVRFYLRFYSDSSVLYLEGVQQPPMAYNCLTWGNHQGANYGDVRSGFCRYSGDYLTFQMKALGTIMLFQGMASLGALDFVVSPAYGGSTEIYYRFGFVSDSLLVRP